MKGEHTENPGSKLYTFSNKIPRNHVNLFYFLTISCSLVHEKGNLVD